MSAASTSNTSCCPFGVCSEVVPQTIAKVQAYGDGKQDGMLNPLVFTSKLAGAYLRNLEGWERCGLALGNFSDEVNKARFPLRFWMGVKAIHQLLNKTYEKDSEDPMTRRVKLFQTLCHLLYNPLELIAYLKMVAPKQFEYDAGPFGRGSAMCWLADLIADYYHLYRAYKSLPQDASRFPVLARVVANTCDVMLAANWSRKNAFLTDAHIGLFGTISGLTRLYLSWTNQ